MEADSESRHCHDPDLQLERLGCRCRSLAPALYREQALYLQIIRDQLSGAVRTAIKHLLCARGVDASIRRADGVEELHRRVDALVKRTSSLLTVAELVKQTAGKIGENVRVRRFTRYTLGEGIEV
ncbi:MAG: hypothetical protein ISQ53_04445, partial [Synechococcus sp. BS307-5m-G39]|nr:hypothetical protein [Synechococcus sp. BS307-5m-G39]